MSSLTDRLSRLSPEQRLLLERRLLQKQGAPAGAEPRDAGEAAELPWLAGGDLQAPLAWWRGHLEGLLPVRGLSARRRPRAAAPPQHGREPFDPPPATAPLLVLFAALAALLGRVTGRTRIVVGYPFRTGGLLNVLPVAVDLSGDPPFTDLLARAAETVARAEAHAGLPLAQLAAELAAAGLPGLLVPVAVIPQEDP